MKLKKLFKFLKRCRPDRKDYYIEPKVVFWVDDSNFSFFVLPTIVFVPWIYRYKGVCCCEIMWLNLHIGIGIWQSKDGSFDSKVKWY
jgi:hypothetical protein